MKSIIILLTLVFCSISLSAQFGVRAKYNSNSFADWEKFAADIGHPNIEIGVDYFFKLKTRRIEFMPELYYGQGQAETVLPNAANLASLDHRYFGLQLNTHIYIMDLASDCDCPTFSKDGPSFKKGFFFNIAPGIVYNTYEKTPRLQEEGVSSINGRIAVGAGYDIGITDLITVTPFVNYTLSFANDAGFIADNDQIETSNWSALQAGIRVGFRPDYVKRYGR